MKVALIADLHGNMPAVEALDRDLTARGIQQVWCLGDVVGKGPSSHLTFDWAMDRCQVVLQGNWDEGIGARMFARDAFYHAQLGETRLRALTQLPLEKHLTLSGRRIRLIHGRPVIRSLVHINSPADQLVPLFEDGFDVVGFADTHRQGQRTLKGLLFKTGSIGNPLGVPMAQYVILEGREGSSEFAPFDITMVTLPYDVEQAVRDTLAQPELPFGEHFIHELRTGQYMRRPSSRAL